MTNSLLEQIQGKRQQIADKKTSGKNPYKFKMKKTIVRILPSWRGSEAEHQPFYHDFGQAFIKDLDGNTLAVIGDRRMCYGEDDEIRNLIVKACATAETDAVRQHYKDMLAKPRVIVNALVLNDSDVDPNTAEILDFSQNQFDTILPLMEAIVLDGENPLDIDSGYNLIIEKEGTSLQTRYKLYFERKPSKASSTAMETVVDLDAFVRAKCAETDRAINALKSVTQAASMPVSGRSLSYNGGGDNPIVQEGDYDVVSEERTAGVREPVKVDTLNVSQSDIEELLKDI